MQQRLLALQQRLLVLARAVWTAVLLLLAALRISQRRTDDEPPADTPASHAAPPTTLASTDAPASPALASADAPLHPLALTADEFAAAASARLGRGGVLARALYRDYHRDGTLSAVRARELQQAPALAAQLCALCAGAPPLVLADGAAAPAPGATEKYVLRTHDGYEVEMVAMPAPGAAGEWSLCVSSQVGCRQGCAFCETGRLGLLRDLSAAEIASRAAAHRNRNGYRNSVVCLPENGERVRCAASNCAERVARRSVRLFVASPGVYRGRDRARGSGFVVVVGIPRIRARSAREKRDDVNDARARDAPGTSFAFDRDTFFGFEIVRRRVARRVTRRRHPTGRSPASVADAHLRRARSSPRLGEERERGVVLEKPLDGVP